MNAQKFRVISIAWYDENSGQGSVLFESESGVRFKCFTDCGPFNSGECVSIDEFYWEPQESNSFESFFDGNPKCEKAIEHLSDWDYFIKGKICALEKDIAYVDCGGLILPIDGLSNDPRIVGEWVGFRANRLEAERQDE